MTDVPRQLYLNGVPRLLNLLARAPSGLSLNSLRRFRVDDTILKEAIGSGLVTIDHFTWAETEEDRAYLTEEGKRHVSIRGLV